MAKYDGTSGNDYYNYWGSESLHANGRGGNDIIHGYNNADYIYGGAGNDFINGWGGDDNLYGNAGNDELHGGGGNDRLWGSGSDSLIYSNGTYSTTYNSGEYDVLNGGAGYNTFVLGFGYGNFYRGTGHAIIEDYDALFDSIQVKGSPSSFRLFKGNFGVGGSAPDTAIFSGVDLLAIAQDTTDIYLTDYYFDFV